MVANHERKKSDPLNTAYLGPALVLRHQGNRVKIIYGESGKVDEVDIHHIKIGSEMPKKKSKKLFPKLHSHQAVEIVGHQPMTKRIKPLREISILVKYESFEEPQLVKLGESGLQNSAIFKKYVEQYPQLQVHVMDD